MHMSPKQYKQYLKERERRGFTGCTAIAKTFTSDEGRGKNPAFIRTK